jgi:ubiquinone/menaquinone biosynthesis C-methylase UbiE
VPRSSIWAAIGRQLRNPSGFGGRLIARLMAVANRRSNRIAIRALDCSPDNTILDLGCGSGPAFRVLAEMAGQGLILGLDHSEIMLAQASRRNRRAVRQRRVHLVRGRIDALPWRDNTIDKILAVHVVYFAGEAGVCEARRVLRPGGRIVIVATDQSAMTRWKFTRSSTHELFDMRGLADLLVRGGFATSEISVTQIKLAPGVLGLLAIATK